MLGPFATASRRTPPVLHCHSPGVACASMSTTTSTTSTTTTTCDRGDRYGPMEWAQPSLIRQLFCVDRKSQHSTTAVQVLYGEETATVCVCVTTDQPHSSCTALRLSSISSICCGSVCEFGARSTFYKQLCSQLRRCGCCDSHDPWRVAMRLPSQSLKTVKTSVNFR